MSGHLRLPRVVNRVDQSGIIVVPTCHVSFCMATPNIHHSVQALTRCVDHTALQWLSIFGFTLMEDDPPILNITAGLATLKRCDTVLAKGSDFNQKGEADIGRHRLRRSSASDRVDQSGIIGVRTCRLTFLDG